MSEDILVIPDIHGRAFWRDAVEAMPDADTIFLGDYHDPYPDEGISPEQSLTNFRDIMAYARTHPNVQLLLGNHDLHYLCSFGEQCRIDFANSLEIYSLLYDNLWHMKVAVERTVAGRKVVFSHAPILRGWLREIGLSDNLSELVKALNSVARKVASDPWSAERLLNPIGYVRGGDNEFGSPVWADISEIERGELIESADYSIFGHTRLEEPIITDRWADLDCRHAFRITPSLSIFPL